MNKQKIIVAAAAVLAGAILMTIGITASYFTEVETAKNIITIGKISTVLHEQGFDPNKTYDIVPGSKQAKAPWLENDGNKDEFVFIKITVPKEQVTLLYEEDVADETTHKKGTPKEGLDGNQQLFRLTATNTDYSGDTPAPEKQDPNYTTTVPSKEKQDIDFSYHAVTGTNAGWILLETTCDCSATVTTEVGGTEETKNVYWDEYIFGYNKKMAPKDKTIPLFDEVQLKSFIDGKVSGNVSIGVYGYGIQAKNLKDTTVDFEKTTFSEDDLKAIYTIVKNKSKAKEGSSS